MLHIYICSSRNLGTGELYHRGNSAWDGSACVEELTSAGSRHRKAPPTASIAAKNESQIGQLQEKTFSLNYRYVPGGQASEIRAVGCVSARPKTSSQPPIAVSTLEPTNFQASPLPLKRILLNDPLMTVSACSQFWDPA